MPWQGERAEPEGDKGSGHVCVAMGAGMLASAARPGRSGLFLPSLLFPPKSRAESEGPSQATPSYGAQKVPEALTPHLANVGPLAV